jgi:Fuc2NAc and GlcNAc transferase
MTTLAYVLAAGLISLLVNLVLIRRAEDIGLIKLPDHRSSHEKPTATGGGMGICIGVLLVSPLFALSSPLIIAALVLATVLAVVGFIDDRHNVSAPLRLTIQFAVVAIYLGLVVLFAADKATAFGIESILVLAIVLVAGVWWINAYNFLDGIDGYAAVEAVFMLGAVVALVSMGQPDRLDHAIIVLCLVVVGATLGFLTVNVPPARIFMGDAGSTFLGFLIFAIAIAFVIAGWIGIWQWLILASVFLADATVALLRRARRRVCLTEAHKSHAYQRLSRRWQSHGKVTGLLLLIDMAIVFPTALVAGAFPAYALWICIGVYAIFALIAAWLGSGTEDGR